MAVSSEFLHGLDFICQSLPRQKFNDAAIKKYRLPQITFYLFVFYGAPAY